MWWQWQILLRQLRKPKTGWEEANLNKTALMWGSMRMSLREIQWESTSSTFQNYIQIVMHCSKVHVSVSKKPEFGTITLHWGRILWAPSCRNIQKSGFVSGIHLSLSPGINNHIPVPIWRWHETDLQHYKTQVRRILETLHLGIKQRTEEGLKWSSAWCPSTLKDLCD